MEINVEQQLLILFGLFLGVSVILIMWALYLCFMVDKLKKSLQNLSNNEKSNEAGQYPFKQPNIVQGEELSKRGYSMHEGQFVPRLASTGDGLYGAPKQSNTPVITRDFIPINDRPNSSSAITNPQRNFDDVSSMERANSIAADQILNDNSSQSNQFNSNFLFGTPVGQTDGSSSGNSFLNDRVKKY